MIFTPITNWSKKVKFKRLPTKVKSKAVMRLCLISFFALLFSCSVNNIKKAIHIELLDFQKQINPSTTFDGQEYFLLKIKFTNNTDSSHIIINEIKSFYYLTGSDTSFVGGKGIDVFTEIASNSIDTLYIPIVKTDFFTEKTTVYYKNPYKTFSKIPEMYFPLEQFDTLAKIIDFNFKINAEQRIPK